MRALLRTGRRRTAGLILPRSNGCQVAVSTFQARRHATASSPRPSESALLMSTKKLRAAFNSPAAIAEIAAEADASVNSTAALARQASELAAGQQPLKVQLNGEVLTAEGRTELQINTPTGPGGAAAVKSVSMVLPTVADISASLSKRAEAGVRAESASELAGILEKFLKDQYLGKSADHVGLISAWGPKPIGDASGEFAEVAALMSLQLRAFQAALESSKSDYQFEISQSGTGKECLVMPPSNFALLGLKDTFHMLLKGYRVLLVVQPRFFPHFLEVQKGFAEAGLPAGLLEVVPGITPEADPEVLYEILKRVDRLQFTGSSAMYIGLVQKAFQLGNLGLEHGGEVSGLNKVRLQGVSASHPAVALGSAWAAMANNGELCTSASLLEFDPTTGDSAESVKSALEAHPFALGRDASSTNLDVLLKDGKTENLEVKTAVPSAGFKEWWEKTVLAVPVGSDPQLRTNQSLGHAVFAKSMEAAVEAGVKEDASCVYCVGVPEDATAPAARAGTTGCKIPESVFGGMKTYTFAVAGDHDGVGSVQTSLDTVKRRGANWRDREEALAVYELTETAEDLLSFLNTREQDEFTKTLNSVLETFRAFEPEVSGPYPGQPLANGDGRSQLVTLPALRPSRKNLLIPRGVGLPDEIIKVALLSEMSPLKETPVELHILDVKHDGKLRVTDPLKSFLKTVEKRLGWKISYHSDMDELAVAMESAEYPPYFFGVRAKEKLPLSLHSAVAGRGGFIYEGLPSDPLTLFRTMTTTQAWTVACTEPEVEKAKALLEKTWKSVGLREEPHDKPEVQAPAPAQNADNGGELGGGFGGAHAMGLGGDKDWAELSDSDSDSDGGSGD